MISRFQINGLRRRLLFNSLYRYSTATTQAQPPQTHFLVDYLINSIGLSKDEAITATEKVKLYKSSRNSPDLVVNFFNELGLTRTQIQSMVSANPKVLLSNVHKTLQPKVLALNEVGISGSDLITVMMGFKSIFVRGLLTRPIKYLTNLLGSQENVVMVIRKFSGVLDIGACRSIEANVQVLKSKGFNMEYISRLMLDNPRCLMQNPARLAEALYTVETGFGIPRASKMFHHGFITAVSISKEKMESKMGVLRSFGFSDAVIDDMIRKYPLVMRSSEDKMRKMWNFFANETACPPGYLAWHPVIFNLSLEKRVIPRYEVWKILNERNMNMRRSSLYGALCISEEKFMNEFLLPYKDDIPAVVSSYFKIVGRKKTGALRLVSSRSRSSMVLKSQPRDGRD